MLGLDGDVGAALREAVATRTPRCTRCGGSWTRHSSSALAQLGIALHAWTVNDADDYHRLARLGVDGLITDVPDVALAVL